MTTNTNADESFPNQNGGDITPYNELYHYGILGMKWGVRRYQNKDGTRTKAGRERYSKKNRGSSATEVNGIIGLLAEVGINLVYDSVKQKIARRSVDKRREKAQKEFDETIKSHSNSIKELKTIATSHSAEDDMAAVNPNYDENDYGTSYNCGKCSLAYEMRRRGYDVCADKEIDIDGGHINTDELAACFRNTDGKPSKVESSVLLDISSDGRPIPTSQKKRCENAMEMFSAYDDDSRGILNVLLDYGGGHSVTWSKDNGTITIRDSQSNREWEPEELFSKVYGAFSLRTDNLEITDEILKYVHNRE